ncbi:hypothetical protein BH23GEM7_BH23GEM7_05070 [soil metagenome]|jgi:hypothetical protein|nr:type I restriction enzyme HsdR N-terminal domain-containing protein [Gemmatimonadota bacterium]
MRPKPSVADVTDDILHSILATPKRQRRLRSKTFWEKFGFKMRTRERVEQVKMALQQRALIVNLPEETFGTEDKDEWLILSHVRPEPPAIATEEGAETPTPQEEWFALMEQRAFESEREVEYYFIIPLFEQLGYEEDDFAVGYPVQMYEGVKRVNKEADLVLFNGPGRTKEDAILIVEAKKTERMLTEDSVGQARAYALWLVTPYYMVTNGQEIRVYLFRGAVQPDVLLMSFRRSELRAHWPALYKTLHKAAVVEYNRKLMQLLGQPGMG